MRYMTLRGNDDVPTKVVPITDDGASPVIRIPVPFPIGSSLHRTVYVCEIRIAAVFFLPWWTYRVVPKALVGRLF